MFIKKNGVLFNIYTARAFSVFDILEYRVLSFLQGNDYTEKQKAIMALCVQEQDSKYNGF